MIPQPSHSIPSPWRIVLVLLLGIGVVATAAIWLRLAIAAMDAIVRQEAGFGLRFGSWFALARMLTAALLLLPRWRGLRIQSFKTGGGWAIAAGTCLGLHFLLWLSSLSYTSIAAATALVTSNPIWMVLICWGLLGERPTRRTLWGITIALTGSITIAVADTILTPEANPALTTQIPNALFGNLLALVGAWAVSAYLLLGRSAQRRGLTLSVYAAIAYASAAVFLLPIPALLGASYTDYPPEVFGYVLLSALGPQLIGHTAINWCVRWVSPTIVTIAILAEPIISTTLGMWIFNEIPSRMVIVGAIVLLTGIAIAVMQAPPRRPSRNRRRDESPDPTHPPDSSHSR
ncbi:MAG: DMT family transporter [Oscillatoriales cyanobacterium]|nr:MAG: DMT family transporter [Oscillatoriales cyanobacterium]